MTLRSGQDLLLCLRSGARVVADGAMGTELIRRGIDPYQTLRANLESPADVAEIHRSYVSAGAQVLKTNTFGGIDRPLWRSAVQSGIDLAAVAASNARADCWLMLSLTSRVVLREADLLLDLLSRQSSPPLFPLLETGTALTEILCAVEILQRCGTESIGVTCHFNASGQMPDGTTPETAARALEEAGVDLIGANCGETPEGFLRVAERMRQSTVCPLLFAPNAGLPIPGESADGRYAVSPDAFAQVAMALYDRGVSIVGGCCGTRPAAIAAIVQCLRRQCAERVKIQQENIP